jgi:carbamoyl-phosphate synthase large subunit
LQAARETTVLPVPATTLDAVTPVLFTCAGQRVDIVTAFKRAGAFTVAADLNPLSPALHHADAKLQPPPVAEESYIPAVAAAVQEFEVRLVVPLTDRDQATLAEKRHELGALLLLPDLEAVERTADKYLTHVFLEEHGFDSPPTWLPEELPNDLEFPLLVKSRFGYGSRHIFRASDRAELDFFLAYSPVEPIVQAECREEEYSIDAFCDLDRRCLNAIPRTMIESKGGESIKGMTIRDEALIDLGRGVAEALELVGPATIQCFRTPEGRHEITDVNPRFGGAFPLPVAAGSQYPELALALARGEQPEPRVGSFREGVVMTRFFSEVILSPGASATVSPISEELPKSVASED